MHTPMSKFPLSRVALARAGPRTLTDVRYTKDETAPTPISKRRANHRDPIGLCIAATPSR